MCQDKVLMLLRLCEGWLNTREIAQLLDIEPRTAHKSLQQLLKYELIEKSKHKHKVYRGWTYKWRYVR